VRYHSLFCSCREWYLIYRSFVRICGRIDAANVESLLKEIVHTLALAVSQIQYIIEDPALIDGALNTVAAVAQTTFDVS